MMTMESFEQKYNTKEGGFAPADQESIEANNVDLLLGGENKLLSEEIETFPENLDLKKKPGVRAMAAFLAFMASSSLFPKKVFSAEKVVPKNELTTVEIKNKNTALNEKDWLNKLVEKINLSYDYSFVEGAEEKAGGAPMSLNIDNEYIFSRKENINILAGDALPVFEDFYGEIGFYPYMDVLKGIYWSVDDSKNAEEFLKKTEGMKMNDKQKIIFLQIIGREMYHTYNYDMEEKDKRADISMDDNFQALKNYLWSDDKKADKKSGVCGNIHLFISQIAEKIGLESWLQNTVTEGGAGHIISGLVATNEKGEKEIYFIDYGTVIATGTLNYSKAMGVLERYCKKASLFNEFVSPVEKGKPQGQFIPAETAAGKIIKKSIGLIPTEERISDNFEKANLHKEKELNIELSGEDTKIAFNNNFIGLSFMNFEDKKGDEYQSINKMQSLGGSFGFGIENIRADAGVVVLNMDMKGLDENTETVKEIFSFVGADFVKKYHMTVGQYKDLSVTCSTTLKQVFRNILKNERDFQRLDEGGLGAKVAYIDMEKGNEFYIDSIVTKRLQKEKDDYDSNLILKDVYKKIEVGGAIDVKKFTVRTSAELSESERYFGFSLSGGVEKGGLGIKLKNENKTSKNERFSPTEKTNEVEGFYDFNKKILKGRISVFGAIENEKYKDMPVQKKYNVGLKLVINLF